mgnify:CR=1 FL=1
MPGVESATAMSGLPPLRQVNANDIDFEDYTAGTGEPPENVDYYQFVHGDYFAAMGIDIVAGRGFRTGDEDPTYPTAVVNERLVATFFKDLDPVGRRVNVFGVPVPVTIVGVAGDGFRGGERLGRIDMWVPWSVSGVLRHILRLRMKDHGPHDLSVSDSGHW